MWNCDGWLGELEDSEGSTDNVDVLDLYDMTSSHQFQEAQGEDAELQELRSLALDTSAPQQAVALGRAPGFEVGIQLLYRVQPGRVGEPEKTQLMVPTHYWHIIWRLAHSNPTRGHME